MLKTTGLSEKSAPKAFKTDNNEVIDGGSSKTNETVRNLSTKSTRVPNIGATRKNLTA